MRIPNRCNQRMLAFSWLCLTITTMKAEFVNLKQIRLNPKKSNPEVALYDVLPNGNGGYVSVPSEVLERRRERDLNSRIQRKHDFQSRAIPGYAISACNLATCLLRLMLTEKDQ